MKVHVVFSEHINGVRLTGFVHVLSTLGIMEPGREDREHVVRITKARRANNIERTLYSWQRSGACERWWLEPNA